MITPVKQGEERFRLTFLPTWLLVGATDRPLPDAAEVINGGCEKCNKALAQAATMPGWEIEGIYCGHCGRLRRGPMLTPFERLAEAAEHLLAEYGVTEPGAGADNHEGPAGVALEALYSAWNQYMRAKHGTPDAVFEPEGMAERKVMRAASDVLTNPKPGDVVRCGTQWQPILFEVSEISERCVVAVVDGMSRKFEYELSQWREWFRGAEVVRVAE